MNRINKTAAQKLIIIFIFSPIFEIFSNFSNFGLAGNRLMIFAIEPHVKTWKTPTAENILIRTILIWKFEAAMIFFVFLDDTIWNIIWIFWRTFWIESFRSEKWKKYNTGRKVMKPQRFWTTARVTASEFFGYDIRDNPCTCLIYLGHIQNSFAVWEIRSITYGP